MTRNKHGLSRNIPEAAKREVRKLCSFGCVICGGIPYDYDHFETEFHKCKEHDINDIVLLCDKHHREKEAIGIDVIKGYLAKNLPKDRDVVFDPTILTEEFEIVWPSIGLAAERNNVLIDDEEVLTISLTGNPLEPVHLDGVFYDDTGTKVCTITKNEFSTRHNNLNDIRCKAHRFEMIAKSGRPIVVFRMEPQKLIIEELFLIKNRAFVIANSEKFILGNGDAYGEFTNSQMTGNTDAVILKSGSSPLIFCDNQLVLPKKTASVIGVKFVNNGVAINWGG